MSAEVWKNIAGFDGLYQVSTCGKIKSFKQSSKGRVLSNKNGKGGYLRCNLSMADKKFTILIHRLVYQTFVGDIPKGMDIDHIDGNKQHNHLSNLQCISRKEQSKKQLYRILMP